MRSHSKDGTNNETMIMLALHNHYYKDLSVKWKRHIKRMFKDIKDNDFIKAHYYPLKDAKPDLVIWVNNSKKTLLSIKSGHSPSVHFESINSFYEFLRELNVPEDIIEIIYFYHYGFKRSGGDRNHPLSRDELITQYSGDIKKVNNYFASNEDILQEIIYRTIIRGRLRRDLIDYFYYGNVSKGYLLSCADIIQLILHTPNDICQSVCFKTLTYVSNARNLDNDRKYTLKINWPILSRWFYDEEFLKRYG